MSRVIFQIGRSKTQKKSQSIKGFINDLEVTWGDDNGTFLTSHKDRKQKNTIWYMYETLLQPQDVLKIQVQTFIDGVGKDLEYTFETLYYCEEDAPVKSVEIAKVGMKNYPLIKGRVLELATVSEDDKRKQEIEDFLNKEF